MRSLERTPTLASKRRVDLGHERGSAYCRPAERLVVPSKSAMRTNWRVMASVAGVAATVICAKPPKRPEAEVERVQRVIQDSEARVRQARDDDGLPREIWRQ